MNKAQHVLELFGLSQKDKQRKKDKEDAEARAADYKAKVDKAKKDAARDKDTGTLLDRTKVKGADKLRAWVKKEAAAGRLSGNDRDAIRAEIQRAERPANPDRPNDKVGEIDFENLKKRLKGI